MSAFRRSVVFRSTFDLEGYETNFPIQRDAGSNAGLDYLHRDTHSFRDVTESLPVPTVISRGSEPTTFGDPARGRWRSWHCFGMERRPRVDAGRSLSGDGSTCVLPRRERARNLLTMSDLERTGPAALDMTVSLSEEARSERILRDLEGTDANARPRRASSWWIPPPAAATRLWRRLS